MSTNHPLSCSLLQFRWMCVCVTRFSPCEWSRWWIDVCSSSFSLFLGMKLETEALRSVDSMISYSFSFLSHANKTCLFAESNPEVEVEHELVIFVLIFIRADWGNHSKSKWMRRRQRRALQLVVISSQTMSPRKKWGLTKTNKFCPHVCGKVKRTWPIKRSSC